MYDKKNENILGKQLNKQQIILKSDKITENGIRTVNVLRNITQPIGVVIDKIRRHFEANFFFLFFKNSSQFLKNLYECM